VHDQASVVEGAERVAERLGAVEGVEVEDAAPPLGAEHARRLVRPRGHASGDHQVVVGKTAAVLEADDSLLGLDPVDLAQDQLHSVGEEVVPAAHDLGRRVAAERYEQVARLVVVVVVPVDHGDRPLVVRQPLVELVRDHRAGGAAAEDEQLAHDGLPAATGVRRSCGQFQ
jgi:hypothetical protein